MAVSRRAGASKHLVEAAEPESPAKRAGSLASDALAAVASGRETLTHGEAADLGRVAGNRATRSLIQAEATAGPGGDRFEPAAGQLASQVMRALQRRPGEDQHVAGASTRVAEEEAAVAWPFEPSPHRAGGVPTQEPHASERVTLDSHTTFKVVIPRGNAGDGRRRPSAARDRAVTAHDRDAEEEAETPPEPDPAAVTAAFDAQAGEVPSVEVGESVSLSDVEMPKDLPIEDEDAVAATITHSPSISRSNRTVRPFGSTRWAVFNITNQTITAGQNAYTVQFTLRNPIDYNVTSPKPSIASANDRALTNANYATAATDLTPRMNVQGGKPRRRYFWARDLTLRHERFHARERSRLNAAGAAQAQTWLSNQTASSVAAVVRLIHQVPARVIASSQAAVGTLDQKESRAYGDGAPSYQARADAIRTRGALGPEGGGYPA